MCTLLSFVNTPPSCSSHTSRVTNMKGTMHWMGKPRLMPFFVPAAHSAGLLKVAYGGLTFNIYVGQDLASTIVAFSHVTFPMVARPAAQTHNNID